MATDMDEMKWPAIGVVGMIVALMGGAAIMSFGPDPIAERIAACMTQPGMQYTDDGCLPIPATPTE